MSGPIHTFFATAFIENLPLKELLPHYPNAKRSPHMLWYAPPAGGTVFLFPFGAVVFHDVPVGAREGELARLRVARSVLTSAQGTDDEFTVREEPEARPDMVDGVLVLDRLEFQRSSVVALTMAQSAAMDYYERIVDQMFTRTEKLVDRLEQTGTVPARTRHLHKVIGATVGTRNEVLSVLHLLDRPDALWDDPGADRVYEELRSEFDLQDRYQALEHKLHAVQDSLELVTDVARDRRLVLLEATVVVLILFEIVASFVRH